MPDGGATLMGTRCISQAPIIWEIDDSIGTADVENLPHGIRFEMRDRDEMMVYEAMFSVYRSAASLRSIIVMESNYCAQCGGSPCDCVYLDVTEHNFPLSL
jgi:hypothetical protein